MVARMPPCLAGRDSPTWRDGPAGNPVNVGARDAHILEQVIIKCMEVKADPAPFDCSGNFHAQRKENLRHNVTETPGSGWRDS